MLSIVEPLRIVDDMWTMTVELTDDSYSGLSCLIAHSVLVDLIGFTTEEAIVGFCVIALFFFLCISFFFGTDLFRFENPLFQAIRASSDKARRREGTLRLKSVKESMERLDLIWEIEFYAMGRSTPVVRNMQTISQLLHIID